MDQSSIRIASGSGFWGDWPQAPLHQVRRGSIDYLVMDYLAEVTMSILQKLESRDPEHGYARDFLRVIDELLPEVVDNNVTILSNAGGVNPHSCKDEIMRLAEKHEVGDLKVAVVEGDDVFKQMRELNKKGVSFDHMDTGASLDTIKPHLQSAHAYLGSKPLIDALAEGADIIVTGRVIDAGLTVAPMAYEFGWSMNRFDRLASATVAGHLLECGGQASGGNFTDWEKVDRLSDLGFPIIEAYEDGSFDIYKHPQTGGWISPQTVKEQLIYEIRDPQNYYTPDVIADFTSLALEEINENRVRIEEVKGDAPPQQYKVSASYRDGYKLSSTLTYSWPRALEKARDGGRILEQRVADLNLDIEDLQFSYIGFNACHEHPINKKELNNSYEEIELRIAARGDNERDLKQLGKQIPPLILTGPPGATGYAGGRPKPSPLIVFWPTLIDKKYVTPSVTIFDL